MMAASSFALIPQNNVSSLSHRARQEPHETRATHFEQQPIVALLQPSRHNKHCKFLQTMDMLKLYVPLHFSFQFSVVTALWSRSG